MNAKDSRDWVTKALNGKLAKVTPHGFQHEDSCTLELRSWTGKTIKKATIRARDQGVDAVRALVEHYDIKISEVFDK